ncbi:F-box-like [Teratosphaeria destructans]|uniref:F-box-like n=1 Tax=Teratosphaeria destructans TaxID=418781 RepID=A0A9W7W3T3_9PEZI|nr:F-box-like [Teratosphaeria destructans]
MDVSNTFDQLITAECHIQQLPEELLAHILQYLDVTPSSITKARQEPSLLLTVSGDLTLKHISRVSKLFRRLTLPILFKHTRLRLDAPPKAHWSKCPFCTESTIKYRMAGGKPLPVLRHVDRYHADMLDDLVHLLSGDSGGAQKVLGDFPTPIGYTMIRNYLDWAPRFYHGLKDLLDFLRERDLTARVESFVLITDKMLSQKLDRFPHRAAADLDWRFKAAAAMWHHLLSITSPSRITILAPPMDLACLTNCAIDTFGDWAFGDMDFHILSLSLPRPPTDLLPTPQYSRQDPIPHRYPGLAPSSLLNLHPWTTLTLNEGAFLKAYGTYEYFERGPPSLIYSIKDSLSPRPIFNAIAQRISHTPLGSLRNLTYTGIFPFANHLNLEELLPQLEELDLQLAPAPDDPILKQPERVGKAELADCWSELVAIYGDIAGQLASFRINETTRLKKFVCRDSQIADLRNELDEVFICLCLPVWAEYEPGVFKRLVASAGEGAFGV